MKKIHLPDPTTKDLNQTTDAVYFFFQCKGLSSIKITIQGWYKAVSQETSTLFVHSQKSTHSKFLFLIEYYWGSVVHLSSISFQICQKWFGTMRPSIRHVCNVVVIGGITTSNYRRPLHGRTLVLADSHMCVFFLFFSEINCLPPSPPYFSRKGYIELLFHY